MNLDFDLQALESAITKSLDILKPKIARHAMNELIKYANVDPKIVKDDPYMKNQKLKSQGKKKLILTSGHSPGDIAMMTAAVRDLHNTYPKEYMTDIETSCNELFEGNPYITKLNKDDADTVVIPMQYPLIHQSNEGSYHFIHGYRKYLEECIGRPIKQGKMKPDIYIRPEEQVWLSVIEEITKDKRPFWIIDAGYKNDFTAKAWLFNNYQKVVDHFKNKIQFVQIGHVSHNHPKLNNVISLVGKTDNRQLIRLFYHASGVLTPVSFPMVLAAGVPIANPKLKNRPCVVISGGREPVQWQMYPNHQFLHTCGTMLCCDNGGCWKSRVVPIGDGDEKDKKNLCVFPVNVDNQWIAKCMYSITVEDVIHAIEKYYAGGVLEYDNRPTIEHYYEGRISKEATKTISSENAGSSFPEPTDTAKKVTPFQKPESKIKTSNIEDIVNGQD